MVLFEREIFASRELMAVFRRVKGKKLKSVQELQALIQREREFMQKEIEENMQKINIIADRLAHQLVEENRDAAENRDH